MVANVFGRVVNATGVGLNLSTLLNQLNRAVIFEKLIVAQLVKNFPAFYRIRRFITVFIRARL
jgi:hypothetical protein